jgi:DNA-binding transcriptional ArsR family regulator
MTNALAALEALSDPTRRAVFERVAAGPAAVGEIARGLPVSRPAVSQHLRVLKDAGLVTAQRDGARNLYRLDPRGLGALRDWLDGHWHEAMRAFAAYVETDPG